MKPQIFIVAFTWGPSVPTQSSGLVPTKTNVRQRRLGRTGGFTCTFSNRCYRTWRILIIASSAWSGKQRPIWTSVYSYTVFSASSKIIPECLSKDPSLVLHPHHILQQSPLKVREHDYFEDEDRKIFRWNHQHFVLLIKKNKIDAREECTVHKREMKGRELWSRWGGMVSFVKFNVRLTTYTYFGGHSELPRVSRFSRSCDIGPAERRVRKRKLIRFVVMWLLNNYSNSNYV